MNAFENAKVGDLMLIKNRFGYSIPYQISKISGTRISIKIGDVDQAFNRSNGKRVGHATDWYPDTLVPATPELLAKLQAAKEEKQARRELAAICEKLQNLKGQDALDNLAKLKDAGF